MILVGLTGGIGSGKSTVSRCSPARGAVIIDADDIIRELQQPRIAGASRRSGRTVRRTVMLDDRRGARSPGVADTCSPIPASVKRPQRDRPPCRRRRDGSPGRLTRGAPTTSSCWTSRCSRRTRATTCRARSSSTCRWTCRSSDWCAIRGFDEDRRSRPHRPPSQSGGAAERCRLRDRQLRLGREPGPPDRCIVGLAAVASATSQRLPVRSAQRRNR